MREQTHRLCSSCVSISWVSWFQIKVFELLVLVIYQTTVSFEEHTFIIACVLVHQGRGSRWGQAETLKVALNVSARTRVSCESLDEERFASELLWLLAGFSSLHVTREGGRETETGKNRDRETLLAVTWSCPCMSCLDISLSLLTSSQASKRERIC